MYFQGRVNKGRLLSDTSTETRRGRYSLLHHRQKCDFFGTDLKWLLRMCIGVQYGGCELWIVVNHRHAVDYNTLKNAYILHTRFWIVVDYHSDWKLTWILFYQRREEFTHCIAGM